MNKKSSYFKIPKPFRHGNAGFTLIELMLVVTIIFGLTGVATLGIIRFIGGASEEMNSSEAYEIQQSVSAYISSGHTISEPFVVTPTDQGVLDPYLVGNLKNSWVVTVGGKVKQVDGAVAAGIVAE
ncbi:MAG TPA: type II secretion system protein [Dehalococcoidia bacterium]|jgi:prepilin-type N-terminal cleavage/methylation domain-containing protein